MSQSMDQIQLLIRVAPFQVGAALLAVVLFGAAFLVGVLVGAKLFQVIVAAKVSNACSNRVRASFGSTKC